MKNEKEWNEHRLNEFTNLYWIMLKETNLPMQDWAIICFKHFNKSDRFSRYNEFKNSERQDREQERIQNIRIFTRKYSYKKRNTQSNNRLY